MLISSSAKESFDRLATCKETWFELDILSAMFSIPFKNYINLLMSEERRYIFLVFLFYRLRGLWIDCSQGRRLDRSASKSERTSHELLCGVCEIVYRGRSTYSSGNRIEIFPRRPSFLTDLPVRGREIFVFLQYIREEWRIIYYG